MNKNVFKGIFGTFCAVVAGLVASGTAQAALTLPDMSTATADLESMGGTILGILAVAAVIGLIAALLRRNS